MFVCMLAMGGHHGSSDSRPPAILFQLALTHVSAVQRTQKKECSMKYITQLSQLYAIVSLSLSLSVSLPCTIPPSLLFSASPHVSCPYILDIVVVNL